MTRSRAPAAEIDIIEEHFHNEQLCVGDDGSNGFQDAGTTAWQLTTDAVASTFGAEVQIYSGALGADYYLDIDKFYIVDMDTNNETYIIELWGGSGLFAAAHRLSATFARRASVSGADYSSISRCPRVRGDLNLWARAKKSGAGAGTIDFLLELHKYPSDCGDIVDS